MRALLNWLTSGGSGLLGCILGFFIAQFLTFYTFEANLKTTKEIQMINLSRDLGREFYHENSEDSTLKDLRLAIDGCEELYRGYNKGGRFNHEQINKYLGFFDDIGFYYTKRALDLEIIKQLFGAHIVETYEYNELRRYIEDLRKNSKQPSAFMNFEFLAEELEKIPEYRELREDSRRGCIDKKREKINPSS